MEEMDVEEIIAEGNEPTWFSGISHGLTVLQGNAWYILAFAGICYYVWDKKLSIWYYKWKENRKIRDEMAKIKKDPAAYHEKEQARINAISRFQDEYNKKAIKMKEIEKEKEEKKRQELLNKYTVQGGRKLNDNYFPLSGNNSKGYVAPTRRTGCPGGC